MYAQYITKHATIMLTMNLLEIIILALVLVFGQLLGIEGDYEALSKELVEHIFELAPIEVESPDQDTRIIDGDTIEVEIDGEKEKVRLIGINAAELNDDRELNRCFAEQSKQELTRLLDEHEFYLVPDETQDNRDRYNRLLRYIILDNGENVNQLMIAGGYAYEYTYDVAYIHQAEFKQAQRDAREQEQGLWGGECSGI